MLRLMTLALPSSSVHARSLFCCCRIDSQHWITSVGHRHGARPSALVLHRTRHGYSACRGINRDKLTPPQPSSTHHLPAPWRTLPQRSARDTPNTTCVCRSCQCTMI